MTDKEKILAKIELLLDETNYEPCTDEVLGRIQSLKELKSYIDSLQEESVREELEKVAEEAAVVAFFVSPQWTKTGERLFKAGAQWQKEHLWKPADGNDLPVIDREVIVLTQKYSLKGSKYAISFAHRPYKGKYIGKSLTTGNIETFENKTYDKGGWSIPDVKFWLDCEWPNKEK